MSAPEHQDREDGEARVERLLAWAMREADRGLAEALARVRREPAPAAPLDDPGRVPEVHTSLRELRTHGGAVPALPLHEGWVVAAGSEALPAEGEGPDEDGPGAERADAEGGSPWTS